ncbi:MAG TPA: hypothetical protein ENH46_05600 [Candidatus Pacearchaeota archaeon]|nr:hypothetical protein [Candidatus Pacearchaeota archaeon]
MTEHLGYIQNVINRMSHNSFLIKGWSITFISLLFILAINSSSYFLLVLSLLPLFCFWSLDAYYLRQEKLFRKLYDAVRQEKVNDSFSMDTKPFDKHVKGTISIMFSHTIAIVYIPITLLNLILQILIIRGII